jgi:HKD family nuclease
MMDSPAIKITYDAAVTVSNEFVVKMSANETGIIPHEETNQTMYRFENTIKMPS